MLFHNLLVNVFTQGEKKLDYNPGISWRFQFRNRMSIGISATKKKLIMSPFIVNIFHNSNPFTVVVRIQWCMWLAGVILWVTIQAIPKLLQVFLPEVLLASSIHSGTRAGEKKVVTPVLIKEMTYSCAEHNLKFFFTWKNSHNTKIKLFG